MASPVRAVAQETPWRAEGPIKNEAYSSGVSWPAVFAGAFAAAALSLILLALGTGLGFSAVSPWANSGASAPAMGGAAIVWLILMQIIAWSMGGYLAGRLRTKWTAIHTDEVYFRDTAHGFLVWGVGTVLTAAFLASAAAAMIGGVARGGASAAGTTAGVSAAEGAARTPALTLSMRCCARRRRRRRWSRTRCFRRLPRCHPAGRRSMLRRTARRRAAKWRRFLPTICAREICRQKIRRIWRKWWRRGLALANPMRSSA